MKGIDIMRTPPGHSAPALILAVGLLAAVFTAPAFAGDHPARDATPALIRSAHSGAWAAPGTWDGGKVSGVAMRTAVRRTEARKVVRHFFMRLSTALVTLLPSFDSNFSGRLSNPKQCFQVSLSTS